MLRLSISLHCADLRAELKSPYTKYRSQRFSLRNCDRAVLTCTGEKCSPRPHPERAAASGSKTPPAHEHRRTGPVPSAHVRLADEAEARGPLQGANSDTVVVRAHERNVPSHTSSITQSHSASPGRRGSDIYAAIQVTSASVCLCRVRPRARRQGEGGGRGDGGGQDGVACSCGWSD